MPTAAPAQHACKGNSCKPQFFRAGTQAAPAAAAAQTARVDVSQLLELPFGCRTRVVACLGVRRQPLPLLLLLAQLLPQGTNIPRQAAHLIGGQRQQGPVVVPWTTAAGRTTATGRAAATGVTAGGGEPRPPKNQIL